MAGRRTKGRREMCRIRRECSTSRESREGAGAPTTDRRQLSARSSERQSASGRVARPDHDASLSSSPHSAAAILSTHRLSCASHVICVTMSVPKTEDVDAEAAAAVVFTQKRKASEVCKKGTDGSGYIEGKMFDKGKMGAGKWEFTIMDTGYRVHISLSGSISLHLSDIPAAVGALVRCDLRGLVLEDIPKDQIKPGSLPKRFLWQDGIVLLVKNTKKNQTAFLDTWKLSGVQLLFSCLLVDYL